jgi:hypothetical protein
VYSNDIRVVAKASHGLCLADNTSPGYLIQFFGLDEGEGYIPV